MLVSPEEYRRLPVLAIGLRCRPVNSASALIPSCLASRYLSAMFTICTRRFSNPKGLEAFFNWVLP
jgi:hypothetical protein